MKARINYDKVSPGGYQAMLALETHLAQCSIDEKLQNLIKLRASQINGCAYCIDMHWKDARASGESELRLYALGAWREYPDYTDRERTALAWTESLTRLEDRVPDAVYESARKHFSEVELSDLTYAVATINAWNRIAISMRSVPGLYQPNAR
jgi:AhpD family alkylhydroperoxidase